MTSVQCKGGLFIIAVSAVSSSHVSAINSNADRTNWPLTMIGHHCIIHI
jgi:hypothetical protein